MKANVIPQVSSVWWKANKGTTVNGAVLEAALKSYETARVEFAKAASANAADTPEFHAKAEKALSEGVARAVDTTISSCKKLLHGNEIAGLKRYHGNSIPKEKANLNKLLTDFQHRYQAVVDDMKGTMETYISTLNPIAKLSAETLLDCEKLELEAGPRSD